MRLTDSERYFNYLRMTSYQFDALLAIVGPSIKKMYHIREPIDPAERLALTLRNLATGDSMISLSYAFRLGKQTVTDIIRDTCKALWINLKDIVFKKPSEESWLNYAKEFETIWNFPHCVGAIDGKHVVMQAPPNSGSQFFNYKGSHSIILLALCDAKYIKKMYHIREPIDPAERLALTLRNLATGDSMISLSYAFRLGKQTVTDIIRDTCKALWINLKDIVFKKHSEESWLNYAKEFETIWNFPHCVGAIDGKHVVMQAPPNAGSQFFNYKGSHSIILLALCDAKYKFITIDVGARGRQSDGGVLRHSELGRRLFSNQLNLPPPSCIEDAGEPVPYFIVGDAAFPLTVNLLGPCPGNYLPLHKKIFNYRLSRARRVSENSFGILVSRWRIMENSIIASLTTVEDIIKATVVIHNWIMSKNEQIRRYCPQEYVDHEDPSGKLIPGLWRKELSKLEALGRIGSNTFSTNAEENLALFFVLKVQCHFSGISENHI